MIANAVVVLFDVFKRFAKESRCSNGEQTKIRKQRRIIEKPRSLPARPAAGGAAGFRNACEKRGEVPTTEKKKFIQRYIDEAGE